MSSFFAAGAAVLMVVVPARGEEEEEATSLEGGVGVGAAPVFGTGAWAEGGLASWTRAEGATPAEGGLVEVEVVAATAAATAGHEVGVLV